MIVQIHWLVQTVNVKNTLLFLIIKFQITKMHVSQATMPKFTIMKQIRQNLFVYQHLKLLVHKLDQIIDAQVLKTNVYTKLNSIPENHIS